MVSCVTIYSECLTWNCKPLIRRPFRAGFHLRRLRTHFIDRSPYSLALAIPIKLLASQEWLCGDIRYVGPSAVSIPVVRWSDASISRPCCTVRISHLYFFSHYIRTVLLSLVPTGSCAGHADVSSSRPSRACRAPGLPSPHQGLVSSCPRRFGFLISGRFVIPFRLLRRPLDGGHPDLSWTRESGSCFVVVQFMSLGLTFGIRQCGHGYLH
jgi:hypothetical protein